MIRIGLLSDTHGYIPDGLFTFFELCDEIWHAGDIGNMETAAKLDDFRPLRAVYGNIDGQDVRMVYPEMLRFKCEGVDVWMTHIGGYPDHYELKVRQEILAHPPKLFICGHSHILKVIYDKKLELLHLNPGAAGRYGLHRVCTALRFVIDGENIREMEIWQAERGLRD
jgi:hypothetical protein